jgi:drug/metabolite transporter (DMT)-like permease
LSAVAIALVLAAAFLHAAWNLKLHAVQDRVAAMAVAGIGAGLVLMPFTIAVPPDHVVTLILLSGSVEAVYALLLSAAYERGELSLVYPVGRGTAPLLATLGAWVFLRQDPTPGSLSGAVLLVLGLLLVAWRGHWSGEAGAVGFAVSVGLAIATYSVIDAHAVREVSPIGYIGPVFAVQGLALLGCLGFDLQRLTHSLHAGFLIMVGSTGAYLLVLFAFRVAQTGRVATLREVSVLIAMFLSGERPGTRAWLGTSLCLLGAMLIAI